MTKVNFNRVESTWVPRGLYYVDRLNYLRGLIENLKPYVSFITFHQYKNEEFDPASANFILDHHIDYYPLELNRLLLLEKELGVISSSYLYAEYDNRESELQTTNWTIDDLDIEFLQGFERQGFEFGYHVNALTLAKLRSGMAHNAKIENLDVVSTSKEIFNSNIRTLRKHFSITTAIPHGAGGGNAKINYDYGSYNLTPVYNSLENFRSKSCRFYNFSDSSSYFKHCFRMPTFSVMTSNFRLEFFAAQSQLPGVHHGLFHPGRWLAYPQSEKLNCVRRNEVKLDKMFHTDSRQAIEIFVSENINSLYKKFLEHPKGFFFHWKSRDSYKKEHYKVVRPIPKHEFSGSFEEFILPYSPWLDYLYGDENFNLDEFISCFWKGDVQVI